MTKSLKYIGLTLILIVIGYLTYNHFVNTSLSILDRGNTQFMSTSMVGQFYRHLIFALALGTIPIFYAIIERVTGLKFLYKGLVTIGIILGLGILSWQFRIFQINGQLKELSKFQMNDGIQNTMLFENLSLEIYLIIGFILGAVLSGFIFKKK